jgi:hypothetical protein
MKSKIRSMSSPKFQIPWLANFFRKQLFSQCLRSRKDSVFPYIGSRVGGIQDLILHQQTGLLVPPADPPALANGLRRLMADPQLRQRLGQAGRQHVLANGMTREGMLEHHAALYRTLFPEP